MPPIKTILLFGAPGSGKGTQGRVLGTIPGFVHVACGDIFRNLHVGSALGRTFLEYSSQGKLVPDDFTIQLWREHIRDMVSRCRIDPAEDILILDGIPRNVEQAKLMAEAIDVLRLYSLECADEGALVQRLKRRALHDNRLDDASEDVISRRLSVYAAETAQILGYYSPDIICSIDAAQKPILVLQDIVADLRQRLA